MECQNVENFQLKQERYKILFKKISTEFFGKCLRNLINDQSSPVSWGCRIR